MIFSWLLLPSFLTLMVVVVIVRDFLKSVRADQLKAHVAKGKRRHKEREEYRLTEAAITVAIQQTASSRQMLAEIIKRRRNEQKKPKP